MSEARRALTVARKELLQWSSAFVVVPRQGETLALN